MSQSLINHSLDLKRLRDEGFEIEVRSNYLLVHAIPYVNSRREIAFGTLASELSLTSPELAGPPGTHVIHFIGDHPCNIDGTEISSIKHQTGPWEWAKDVIPNFAFSNKPRGISAYSNYYDKFTNYINIIWHQASAIDSNVDPHTFKLVESIETNSVFKYADTASSRAGIQAISGRLSRYRIAIVGLGGTGSYILDLVAKTHVCEIHLFDGDLFRQHNAFRSPGAMSRTNLDRRLSKVDYLTETYSQMRNGIFPHYAFIDETNVTDLNAFDFVFICVDKGSVRKLIIESLQKNSIDFIDVGMDVHVTDEPHKLWGTCRVTTSSSAKKEHVKSRISMVDRDGDDLYASNIQTADLNAINAGLAVVRWKRHAGFYYDDCGDHNSSFNTSLNVIVNSESRP